MHLMKHYNYKSLEIKKCRACDSSALEDILSLGTQYLSDFTIGNKKPEKYPLSIMLCIYCN